MNGHLDLDALADVLAGVAVPEHLDSCPSCRARLAELAAALPAATASLTGLPTPAEPADLAARLSDALAQARAEQPSVAGGDVVPIDAGRARRGGWAKAAAGVAAAAVLVTGVVLVAQRGGGHGATQAGKRYTVSSTGNDYAAGAAALSKALPALLRGTAATAPPVPAEASGTTAQQDKGFVGAVPSTVDALAGLRSTSGLAACLAALSDPSQPGLPLALDYARFKGTPALVVVLPSSKADKVDVFVVGRGCSQADAKVLFFARLPKP